MGTTAPPTEVAAQWPCTPLSARRARRQLAALLDEWGLGALADSALLVLSELIANAVRHARTTEGMSRDIGTVFVRDGDGVRIEVHDTRADRRPALTDPRPLDETGRGLHLVDALTEGKWGVNSRTGPGKAVWAHVTPGS
ncbi:ATP-binding protein [Actinacidiphila alni]|uniref:ATP-binding protein n=1 Tax=Actinacidiphila alni TaxID=380248 RepID=UPI00345280FD